MDTPFWLQHKPDYFFLKARPWTGVHADLMNLHAIGISGIPDDTLILAVPSTPGEDNVMGYSEKRSVVVKNVKY